MGSDSNDNGVVCENGVCHIDFSKRRKAQAASSSTSDIPSRVEDTIASNRVVIYSKTYCPYCDKAKALFKSKGVDFVTIELDNVQDGEAMHGYLKEKTAQTTVPNIFVSKKHVGGFTDLRELEENGELQTLLSA
ncbi:hypothetical protein SpCBS45565_g00029 [Spizellomyces sp. 'palustris']|nr:hypothetical protein SpCBS45565_g00029 [Spizellomyces sp. 'palustris']